MAPVNFSEIMYGGKGGVMHTDPDFAYDETTQTLSATNIIATSFNLSTGGDLTLATVSIPTASVLTLNGTPVTLVAAPAAGTAIVVDRITASLVYGTAAYATNTTIEFRYTNGSGTKVVADITALLTATADKIVSVSGIEAATVLTSAAALVAVVPTGNPATGDSNIKIQVLYHTVTI